MAKKRRDVEVPEVNGEHIVTIENFGPIERAEFRFVPGRITVAYGSNGAGKSESQIAVDALSGIESAKDQVSLREGAEKGRISGFGRELKFTAKRCDQTGQINVCVVEEGFSLARFVRPGFKNSESNDRQRLKDLASLLEIAPDPKSVFRLVGGLDAERGVLEELPEAEQPAALAKIEAREKAIYNSIVSDKTTKAKDPAEYVSALKSDCDKSALENEKLAIAITGEADGLEDSLPEIPPDAVSDAEVLTKRLTDAIGAKSKIKLRDDAALEAGRLAKEAERILTAGQGQTVEQAADLLTAAEAEVTESQKLIDDMEAALGRERTRIVELRRRVTDATQAKTSAEERKRELDGARDALQANAIRPSAEEWAKAEAEIKAAEGAVTLGTKIRESVKTRQKIADKRNEAIELTTEAEGLRSAAKRAVNLLVEPINALKCGIEIDDDLRLIFTEHPKRGRCPVEELSPGECWSLVIRLIVKVVGGDDIEAIVTIPQEALEGLDPINLKMFVEEIAKTKLMVFVAKATATEMPDGQLVRDGVISKLVDSWKDLR